MRWRVLLERAFPPFSDRKREKPREMLYIATERPGWPLAIIGGAQHALVALMLVIYTVIIGQALEIDGEQLRGFVSLEIIVMGLVTLVQSLTTRLSAGHLVVHIPSTLSMAGFIAVASTFGLEAAAGGLLVAGIAVFALSRFLSRLQAFFPPEVSGVLLVLLGLTLVQSGVTRFTGLERGHIDPTAVIIAATTLGSIIAVSVWTPGRLRVFAVAIGAGAGLLVAIPTAQFGMEQIDRVAALPTVAFPWAPTGRRRRLWCSQQPCPCYSSRSSPASTASAPELPSTKSTTATGGGPT